MSFFFQLNFQFPLKLIITLLLKQWFNFLHVIGVCLRLNSDLQLWLFTKVSLVFPPFFIYIFLILWQCIVFGRNKHVLFNYISRRLQCRLLQK